MRVAVSIDVSQTGRVDFRRRDRVEFEGSGAEIVVVDPVWPVAASRNGPIDAVPT